MSALRRRPDLANFLHFEPSRTHLTSPLQRRAIFFIASYGLHLVHLDCTSFTRETCREIARRRLIHIIFEPSSRSNCQASPKPDTARTDEHPSFPAQTALLTACDGF